MYKTVIFILSLCALMMSCKNETPSCTPPYLSNSIQVRSDSPLCCNDGGFCDSYSCDDNLVFEMNTKYFPIATFVNQDTSFQIAWTRAEADIKVFVCPMSGVCGQSGNLHFYLYDLSQGKNIDSTETATFDIR